MGRPVEGRGYTFRCGGEELARVLTYYGLIPDMSKEHKITCPFHHDARPSMVVNLDTGKFYCFGCDIGGDAYDFVKQANPEMGELEAMQKLVKILRSKKVRKLKLPTYESAARSQKDEYEKAYDFYYGLPSVDWTKDGFREITHTREYVERRGFSPETLNEAKAKVTYDDAYLLVFPMLDNGEFKGWVCRTTDPKVEKQRKYLYNKGFSRRTTLVGDYTGCEVVFVVEGYMDRLKFIQHGVKNVVAILGWKMTAEQEQKLKESGVKCIVSALDNDECGRKGTKYLQSRFPNVVRFKYLKGIKDPGETTKELFYKMYNKTMKEVKV